MTIETITSLQNPLIKHWKKLQSSSSYRKETQSILLEGKNLVLDVCQHIRAKRVISRPNVDIPKELLYDILTIIPEYIVDKISSVKSPEGWFAELSLPQQDLALSGNRIIVLDTVSDPGNLGTLIRSSLALGWDGIFILDGSCDPFNDKALRAAKGATFFLPIQKGSWEDLKQLIQNNQYIAIAANLEGHPPSRFQAEKKLMLILGNEAKGLSQETHKLATSVTIPMSGKMESLNVAVAGSILMYALGPIMQADSLKRKL